jgi:hypothetical protein
VDLCIAVCGWPNVGLDGVGVANIFGGWENVCRDGVGVGAILCGGGSDRTDASFGAISGNGVGVGVGDWEDRARLYLIWLNAIEATNSDATVETMIRVIIKRFDLGLIWTSKGY